MATVPWEYTLTNDSLNTVIPPNPHPDTYTDFGAVADAGDHILSERNKTVTVTLVAPGSLDLVEDEIVTVDVATMHLEGQECATASPGTLTLVGGSDTFDLPIAGTFNNPTEGQILQVFHYEGEIQNSHLGDPYDGPDDLSGAIAIIKGGDEWLGSVLLGGALVHFNAPPYVVLFAGGPAGYHAVSGGWTFRFDYNFTSEVGYETYALVPPQEAPFGVPGGDTVSPGSGFFTVNVDFDEILWISFSGGDDGDDMSVTLIGVPEFERDAESVLINQAANIFVRPA